MEILRMSEHAYADLRIEYKLLATLIEKPAFIDRVRESLFTGERIKVYRALAETYAQYNTVTLEGLKGLLEGKVPEQLIASTPGHIKVLLTEATRLAHKRQIRDIADQLLTEAESFSPNMVEVGKLAHVNPVNALEDSSLQTGASAFLTNFDLMRKKEYPFITTGFHQLDRRMAGEWKRQCLTIVLGQPGSAKTTLVTNTMLRQALPALRVAQSTDDMRIIPALFFSLEMPKDLLFPKMIADYKEINYSSLLIGEVTAEEYDAVLRTADKIQQLPIYILDNPDIRLSEMVHQIREHHTRYNIEVVYVDYLQIVNHSTGNLIKDLGAIAKTLRDIGKELNIAIVILSQVTPSNDGLERVRDSREPGQVADVVFELIPGESAAADYIKDVTIEYYKNRYGPLGKSNMLFNGRYQQFIGSENGKKDNPEVDG